MQRLQERAARTAAAFQERLRELPLAMAQMCAALHLLDAGEPWASFHMCIQAQGPDHLVRGILIGVSEYAELIGQCMRPSEYGVSVH